jgi:mono/diheme cytochrome c family protein
MKTRSLLLLMMSLIFAYACSSDSDDDMPPVDNNDSKITYTVNIRPIRNGNCKSCHGSPATNGAPMSLTTYNSVKTAVQSQNLISQVENGSMPPAGNLTTAQIQLIKDWQSDGLLE